MGPSKSKQSRDMNHKSSVFSNVYLCLYNFLQVLGWSHILVQLVLHYVQGNSTDTLWEAVKLALIVFQNAAVLEVVNVAAGLVKSNLVITVFQVASRVMVVCGVLLPTPTAPKSYGLPLLLLAWSVTEVIRYSYYALNILNIVPFFLIWCRYTFFIALYPIGVTGELLCFYAAQSYVGESQLWSYSLPNALNFAFSYQYMLICIMLSYIPLFPRMYLHMFSQRKKVLVGAKDGKTK